MIERAIPRFAGPKTPWTAFLNTTTLGDFNFFPRPASNADYWIESIDTVQLTPGSGSSGFSMFFLATAVGGAPRMYFFGNQVSANTGVYFPYRGLIRLAADLYFTNAGGSWAVYVSGFITTTVNEVA